MNFQSARPTTLTIVPKDRGATAAESANPRARREVSCPGGPIYVCKRPMNVIVRKGMTMQSEVNVLALVKGKERFIYVYDDDSQEDLIDAIRDHAAHPGLSLSWFDANVLSRRAREQVRLPRVLPAAPPCAEF